MNKNLIRIAILTVLLVVIGLSLFVLPVQDYLTRFLDWVRDLGPMGMVALGLVYILACVIFLPGFILTLGAGFAFGVVYGTVTVSIASTLGAAAAFLLGRTLARDFVARKVSGNPRFAAIDRAVEHHGFKIVLLTRLSPIFPFNLLNYAYGLTGVSFRQYFFASWIGMLPGTVMYVYLGSALQSLAAVAAGEVERGAAQNTLFIIGLLATVAVVILVTRIARRALAEEVPDDQAAV